MAFSTIIKLFILFTTSEILVFGFEPVVTYDFKNGNQKNIHLKLDVLLAEQQNDKSNSSWIHQYCLSKVGVTRSEFPCNFKLEQKNKDLPRNCQEVQSRGKNISGLYEIQPDKSKNSFIVLCDMEIKGGGWTHIHKRFDGSVDFKQNWREYKFGFGDLNGEFWIGLENIHSLTGINKSELLVELVDRENKHGYARYEEFRVGSEPDGYPLERASNYSGDAGDCLWWHVGMKFTTKDVDQDKFDGNCAEFSAGAYWYNNCYSSNLNGDLINHELRPSRERQGMSWDTFRNVSYVLAKARMLIRPFSSN